MNRFCLSFLLIVSSLYTLAQSDSSWSGSYYQGYSKSLRGGGFGYHSPQPDVTSSLLIRASDSTQFIEWETESLPEVITNQPARFIWMFGIDANPLSYNWKLFINGEYLLTFTNPVISEKKSWTVKGIEGVSLDFRPTLLDKYNDPLGYAILTVPFRFLQAGQPQIVKVVAESAGKMTWYMTYESPVEEQISLLQEEALLKGEGGNYRVVRFQFVHLGDPLESEIRIEPDIVKTFTLETGYNSIQILIPDTKVKMVNKAMITLGNREPFQMLVENKSGTTMDDLSGAAYTYRYRIYSPSNRNLARAFKIYRLCTGFL